jgi:hypothetical protein
METTSAPLLYDNHLLTMEIQPEGSTPLHQNAEASQRAFWGRPMWAFITKLNPNKYLDRRIFLYYLWNSLTTYLQSFHFNITPSLFSVFQTAAFQGVSRPKFCTFVSNFSQPSHTSRSPQNSALSNFTFSVDTTQSGGYRSVTR